MTRIKPPLRLSAPDLTDKALLGQFKADIFGKEVQTTATYSYTWVADQVGHVAVGIIINFVLTVAAGLFIYLWNGASLSEIKSAAIISAGSVPGLLMTVIGVAGFEFLAYEKSVREATGTFRLDAKLLRANAFVATAYMCLGAVIGFAFHRALLTAALIFIGAVVIAIVLAPYWLRQKITWQKAALPYLFRLADAPRTLSEDDIKGIEDLIGNRAPPLSKAKPTQIVIGGPINSGRTSLACGIGTEFAFNIHKVRYLSLDELLEFAAHASDGSFPDDLGPQTVSYWPWCAAQVVIIDNVGPLISANEPTNAANVARFKELLDKELSSVADVLSKCHTVWVIGDLRFGVTLPDFGDRLEQFAGVIAAYCKSDGALAVELGERPPSQLSPRVRWVSKDKVV